MLKAFVDDSGSGGDSPWFVLAGYIGTVEKWDMFDTPWQSVLDGPPKLDYFKASEAESLRPDGQWAGITKKARNDRLDSFIGVIGKHAKRALYVRTKQKDYDEVIKPYVPPQWQNAYYFLFIGMLSAGTFVEKYASGECVEFFFDSSQQHEKPSRLLYSQIASQFSGRIVDVHYENEKIFFPLQAADLLAWQIRRRFSVEEEPRPQFEAALRAPSDKYFEYTITRDRLNELGEAMDQHAMLNWALMGYPESMRKWKRPR